MTAVKTEPEAESDRVAIAARVLEDRHLLVASNREPYSHEPEDGEVVVTRPAGGLTSALDPVLQALGGTWVAWGSGDADFDVVDEHDRVGVPPEDPAYELQRLRLSQDAVREYYYGYSNQVLWPLCHGMPSKVHFDEDFWTTYRDVNAQFADAIAGAADERAVVWFQDYHLALAPALVRRARPSAFLAQFWHIPWPAWEVFQRSPNHGPLLAGLLGNDLLGFHADEFGRRFIECARSALGAEVDHSTGMVTHDGHTTYVRTFPLGVDSEAFDRRARSDEATTFWESFVTEHELGDRVALGVDRLDYTKGILQRLDALERCWEESPQRRGELTYVQKASESRSRIDEYRQLQREVEERIAALNERFRTDGWTPVVYTTANLAPHSLAALYRHADVALVSPLRDGMNLVAKEYIAAQVDEDGVLVLSELAGAAGEFGDDALVINPNDTEQFAATIEAALSMPERTRRRRMRSLRRQVSSYTSYDWVNDQFGTMEAIEAVAEDEADEGADTGHLTSGPVSVWGGQQAIVEALSEADGLFIAVDFDGTLAELTAHPDDAAVREDAVAALESLAEREGIRTAVISGRSLDDVRSRVGVEGIAYAGNHGFEIAVDEETRVLPGVEALAESIAEVSATLRERLRGIEGVVIEEKGPTASVHYRMVEDALKVEHVRSVVEEVVASDDTVSCHDGKEVIELRPEVDWDKGRALEWLRETYVPDDESWVVGYLGDDTTDEAAFRALDERDIGVKVGPGSDPTAASYVVAGPGEVADLLEWFAAVGESQLGAGRPAADSA